MIDSDARKLFTAAAIFNFAAGLSFLLAAQQVAQLIGMKPVPSDPLWLHFGAVLVLAFGWGYWRVAGDPVRNRPIIEMGILGKSLVVIAGYTDWLLGNVNWPFAALITGDLIFAALFWSYLRRTQVVSLT